MRATAYLFAQEVDEQVEALSNEDYHLRRGRAKLLLEELYPISRLALHFKQPGLRAEVEAFEDSSAADAHIQLTGFREQDFDVQVTCTHDAEEALRSELLVRDGWAPGAGPIHKKTKEVEAELTAADYDGHVALVSTAIQDRFQQKQHAYSYGPNTILLIGFDEVRLSGRHYWSQLLAWLDRKLERSDKFLAVFLFNCATAELRSW
ncbi:MAG: hypothetical protein AAF533_11270 [Acidobacteriota bacterium]